MAEIARSSGTPFIVLVEDNQADVFLIQEALHAECPSCEIQVFVNGNKLFDSSRTKLLMRKHVGLT